MKRLRSLFGIILCMLFMGVIVSAASDICKLYYDIDFEENIMFDKYDVEMYMDGQQVATLPHGKRFSLMTEAEKGKHTVYFYKKDDKDVNGSVSVNIKADASFVCSIQAEGKEVKIKKYELTNDLSAASIKMPEITLSYLKDAEKDLKDLGYLNIVLTSDEGKSITASNDWIIIKQNIEPGKSIDQNEEIILTAKKVQAFLDDTFIGKTVSQAGKIAEENKFYAIYVDQLNDCSITEQLHDHKQQELWKVSDVSVKKSNQRLFRFGLEYTGNHVLPDVTKMELSHAIKRLHEENFKHLVYQTKDKNEIKEKNASDYYVITMSPDAGKALKVDTKIVLTCEPYSELSEEHLITVPEIQNVEPEVTKKEPETERQTEAAAKTEKAKETEAQTEKETKKSKNESESIKETEKDTEKETEQVYTDAATIKSVQTALNELGYDCGSPDGIAGKATLAAITAYAAAKGIAIADGKITDDLLTKLKADQYKLEIQKANAKQTEAVKQTEAPVQTEAQHDYILNTNTYKFHIPGCSSVNKMAEHNKEYYTGTRSNVINRGFVPCQRCNP